MSLDHILLGMLRQPSTGYDIKNRFKNDIRVFWSAELSQIYPTLKRLEKNGWLRSRTEPSPKGPARRVYRPTAAGRAELTRWLRSGPVLGSERFAYLAQLFFMDALGNVEETRGFLLKLRESLQHWLADLQKLERAIVEQHGDASDRYSDEGLHRFATLRMGIHSISAKVTWCDETLSVLDTRLARERGHRKGGPTAAEEV